MKTMAGEPLYQTIINDIRQEIFTGKLSPNDMLQSENELALKYGTTRVTVRKGLDALENEGLIFSCPGKGYFVSMPQHDRFSFEFRDETEQKNIDFSGIRLIQADEELQSVFHFEGSRRIIEIGRKLKRDGHIVGLDLKYLRYIKGIPLIEKEINYSLFPELITWYTKPFAFYTKMKINAELLSGELCELLEEAEPVPVLVIRRYFIDKNETVIGYGKQYLKSSEDGLIAYSGYRNGGGV